MKRRLALAHDLAQALAAYALVTAVALMTARSSAASFTPIDYPGAGGRTSANDVSGTQVVGVYYDTRSSASHFHGFLYESGSYTPLDHPSATFGTSALGISGSTIVGYYTNGPLHGFIYDHNFNAYTTLDYPAALSTLATGIDGSNIVGYYLDADSVSRGFKYDGSSFSAIDFPGAGAFGTRPSAISAGRIVGSYLDVALQTHGFVFDGTTYQQLDVPGADYTIAYGISAGTIVGTYHLGGVLHGFVYDGASYTTFDHPSIVSASVNHGIDGSTIVGEYDDLNGPANGFAVLVPEPASAVLAATAMAWLAVRGSRQKVAWLKPTGAVGGLWRSSIV